MNVDLFYLNVFYSDVFFGSGNKACVVISDEEIENISQSSVKIIDAPIVCFINKVNSNIRFFSVNTELPFCVHGSIAVGRLLNYLNNGDNPKLITNNKKVISLLVSDNKYGVSIKGVEFDSKVFDSNEIKILLGIDKDIIIGESRIVSIGSKKCIIKIKNFEYLNQLEPNFDMITEWSKKNKINGIYIYTENTFYKDLDFQCRSFNPLSGIEEDSATGVAAGALSWIEIIKKNKFNYKIGQGKNNTLNEIEVRIDESLKTTTIFGNCCILEIKKDYDF